MDRPRDYYTKWNTCDCQGRGIDWEFGISRCKLLYMGCINKKVLLYSTGSYIQYPVISHSGKEIQRMYVCVCVCVCVYTHTYI